MLRGSTRPPSPDYHLQGADFRQLWKGLEETSSSLVLLRKRRNSQLKQPGLYRRIVLLSGWEDLPRSQRELGAKRN